MRLAHALCLPLALLCGCSLILDFDDPPGPADAAVADAIPPAACDFGEPNETRGAAFTLAPVSGQVAGICDLGEHDFYAITVVAGQALSFEILFDQDGSDGDLDLRLIDESDGIVARSLSGDADEAILCPGPTACPSSLPAGNYFIDVYGYQDTKVNDYTINYTLTGP
jgi:hypothetical protein